MQVQVNFLSSVSCKLRYTPASTRPPQLMAADAAYATYVAYASHAAYAAYAAYAAFAMYAAYSAYAADAHDCAMIVLPASVATRQI